jgi:hypothetical protein
MTLHYVNAQHKMASHDVALRTEHKMVSKHEMTSHDVALHKDATQNDFTSYDVALRTEHKMVTKHEMTSYDVALRTDDRPRIGRMISVRRDTITFRVVVDNCSVLLHEELHCTMI